VLEQMWSTRLARCRACATTHRRRAVHAEGTFTALVPGDVVQLLVEVSGLECEESVLTGESFPVGKTTAAVPAGMPLAELTGAR
jgi:magnesium-transporting ATPase (P-type)